MCDFQRVGKYTFTRTLLLICHKTRTTEHSGSSDSYRQGDTYCMTQTTLQLIPQHFASSKYRYAKERHYRSGACRRPCLLQWQAGRCHAARDDEGGTVSDRVSGVHEQLPKPLLLPVLLSRPGQFHKHHRCCHGQPQEQSLGRGGSCEGGGLLPQRELQERHIQQLQGRQLWGSKQQGDDLHRQWC